MNNAAIAALIAAATAGKALVDDDCAKKSGRTKIEKQVRDEAEKRFLDEHPDLSGGN